MEKFFRLLKITMEVILVIVFIFFEELIWKKLALPVKNYISKLKILESTKETIMEQSAYTTLAIFLVPLAIAEGMGIYSGLLFVSGSILTGAFIYALKIPVAGITFWIFSFTKEKLLTIDWFETLFGLLMRFINFIKDTQIYKDVKLKIEEVKASLNRMKPGNDGFSKEINHVYAGLKNIFKGAKAIDETGEDMVEEVSKEVDEKNKEHKEFSKMKKEKEDEFVDPVERIAKANEHRVIPPNESRRSKIVEENPLPEKSERGSAKR